MAGQSATLSIKEAKAMMARTEAHKVGDHQGPKNAASQAELCKKEPHQGK